MQLLMNTKNKYGLRTMIKNKIMKKGLILRENSYNKMMKLTKNKINNSVALKYNLN